MTPTIADPARTGELVAAVTDVVDAAPAHCSQLRLAEQVADAVRGFLHLADLLAPAHQLPDADHYRQHVLHVDAAGRFSVVSLVWLPGQRTPIHDHTTWCVAGTYRGCEQETGYRYDGAGLELEPVTTSFHPAGAVTALAPPGDIHQVSNCGAELAVSIHVYGADVVANGGSIRRCYQSGIQPRR